MKQFIWRELKIIKQDPKLIITLPIALIILLILLPFKKLFFFRFGFLHSDRIGHFAMNTELSILEDKKFKRKSVYDFYYFGGKICNNFLGKKWSEILNIYPKIFIRPFCLIVRRFSFFKHNVAGGTSSSDNDIFNLFEKFSPQIKLSKKDIDKGYKLLESIGVKKKSKIVCLIVRDDGYLEKLYKKKQSYHKFRNMDIKRFNLAVKFLTSKGYYVFRMGDYTKSKLELKDHKYFDYSKSNIKSDFMDIFLGSNCHFCISTNTGFDAIPMIFRKPILYIGSMPVGIFTSNTKKIMVTTKYHISKLTKKKLSISEIFSNNLAYSLNGYEFKNKKIYFKDLNPLEIKNVVTDMLHYINRNFKLSKHDEKINQKFWKLYINLCSKYPSQNKIHGNIKCKISPSFLIKNKFWMMKKTNQLI